jgi:hypothetical protein
VPAPNAKLRARVVPSRAERHRAQDACVLYPIESLYRNLYAVDMKTTLDLNDQLLTEAKALAARRRTSLTRLIEEGLQLRLRAESDAAPRPRVRLPVFKGRGGLIAGVDPLSNRSLLEAADDDA